MDSLDFPPELCSKPLALIGLCGLDVQSNSLHRTIWESFSRSHDKSQTNFKLFNLNHVFPSVKLKRTSYDWYIPKGILKKNWMKKRLLEIPAVIALLFDWEDTSIETSRFVSQFQNLRASLGSHGTKIVVILIQKVAPLPEDVKTSEKAKALCAACDIETKQLYVLPHGDHLQGYIAKLENALFDLAQNYYHQEIKLIKQHKDQLNKTTQMYLFVRHQFKLGFLSELKQDNHNAKKYYDLAHNYLKEIRISDTNIVEVKLIAGFINYKLCYLMFRLNQPRDAITHFRSHIEYYKSKVGAKELIFEHYSWLSKQYSAFGDIFDDAVRQGLPPVQTQHPGFYYRFAAQYAMDRKLACLELCKDVTAYPISDPLTGLNSLEFFGQRPWRPGKLSAEPINPGLELEGITALKYKENFINHSAIIISLLGSAISQFKTYRCPRMRLQLVVQMADEYFNSKDYGKALTLFSHIIWDYKDEKWWLLLSTLLNRALSCAYMAASVQDYVIFSMEALGPLGRFDFDRRKAIFNNLMSVLQCKSPEPEPEITPQNITLAQNLWEAVNRSGQPVSTTVEINNVKSCIEVKARFTKQVFNVNEILKVDIFIRSSLPYAVEFSQLSVVVNFSNSTSEFNVSTEKNNLKFEPGISKKLVCEFQCNSSEVGKCVQIGSLLLTFGSAKERLVVLKYCITVESSENITEKPNNDFKFQRLTVRDPVFDQIENLTTANIISAESQVKIDVKHDSPALLSEWYQLKVNIFNDEKVKIGKGNLEVKFLSTPEDVTAEQTTQLCADVKNCIPVSVLNLPLEDIPQNENKEINVYVRGHRVGNRNIIIKFNFTSSDSGSLAAESFVETQVTVPIIQPFEVSAEILSMKFEQMEKCFAHYPFILSPTIRVLSPWPLKIYGSTLEPGLMVKSCDKNITSHLAGTVLNEGEGGTDVFPLTIEEPSEQPLALGTYSIKWSRNGGTEVTSSSVTMPTIMCESAIVGVEMKLPAHGWVRKPMKVEYNLCNHTNNLLQLDLLMKPSDAFMFAGQKQVYLRLLPGSVKKLEYNLYPLFSGLVALPRLTFRSPAEEFVEQINQVADRNLLSHIYVMPQEKLGVKALNSSN